jgi:hypothetical protein
MSLVYIGQQLNIFGGFFFLVTGLIGNGINIFIMSSVRDYFTVPCTFYFLIVSIVNTIYIIINLIIRIVSAGFGIDLVITSLIWCKIRAFIVSSLSPISLTCSCLAMIDQFLTTSPNVNLRRFSSIKWAHRIVVLVIIVWYLHGISIFIYYSIPPIIYTCISTDPRCPAYVPIYVVVVLCAIPVIVMVVFGYLTYCNIRLTRRLAQQHADRQVTKMTLIQVVLVIVSMTPAGIFSVYRLLTADVSKDINRQIQENFVNILTILLSYFYYVVCIFIIKLIRIYFMNYF